MTTALSAMPPTPAPPGLWDDVKQRIDFAKPAAPRRTARRLVLSRYHRVAVAVAAGIILIVSIFVSLPTSDAPYRLVVVDQFATFTPEEIELLDALEGDWLPDGESDSSVIYAKLLKGQGQ